MLLRDNNPEIPSPDCWSLIGGGIEEGETSMAGLIREIREEANIGVSKEQIKFLFTTNDGFRDLYLIYLTDEQAAQTKLGDEGQAVKYWSFKEIGSLKMGKMIRTYYEEYKEMLKELLAKNSVN